MGKESPTDFQRQVAAALGIDISRDSKAVAGARIQTFVGPALLDKDRSAPATERQLAFAEALGLDVRGDSNLVASAKIADELFDRNTAAAERLRLKPGDRVRVRHRVEVEGKTHDWLDEHVVSSIQPNCRIMFKGGNGMGAWPTQVEKVEEPVAAVTL
jgi:hypothetical protein